MPSPGAFSSVSDAPSLSFSPLPAGFFAIDFTKEPSSGGDGHPCMAHAVTSPVPPADGALPGGGWRRPACHVGAREGAPAQVGHLPAISQALTASSLYECLLPKQQVLMLHL